MRRLARAWGKAGMLAGLVLSSCSSGSPWGATVAGQCNEVMKAYCARADGDCHSPLPNCVATNVAACCQSSCDAFAISSEDDVAACTGALARASCATLATGVPGECVGVVRKPR